MDPAAGTGSGGVGAGAGKTAAAAPPAAGAAAAARRAMKWKSLRRMWAQALVVFGCAAAALAFFSINSASPTAGADSLRLLGRPACARSDAEAAALRAASETLLALAAAQVLGATAALLVPARRKVAVFALVVGFWTGYRAGGVLLRLFECHGRVDDVVATFYYFFVALVFVAYIVGDVVVENSA